MIAFSVRRYSYYYILSSSRATFDKKKPETRVDIVSFSVP